MGPVFELDNNELVELLHISPRTSSAKLWVGNNRVFPVGLLIDFGAIPIENCALLTANTLSLCKYRCEVLNCLATTPQDIVIKSLLFFNPEVF